MAERSLYIAVVEKNRWRQRFSTPLRKKYFCCLLIYVRVKRHFLLFLTKSLLISRLLVSKPFIFENTGYHLQIFSTIRNLNLLYELNRTKDMKQILVVLPLEYLSIFMLIYRDEHFVDCLSNNLNLVQEFVLFIIRLGFVN